MKVNKYYKILFLVGGIWNIVAAITCWILSISATTFFFNLFKMPEAPSLFAYHCLFAVILALGIGCIIVSSDITKNHGLVIVMILGKILFFIVCLVTYFQNEANIFLVLIGIVDFTLSALFLEFLTRSRKLKI